MMKDFSFGIIPLCKKNKEWHVFLIKHKPGKYWGFPKGHKEPLETPKEAAARELQEESGLLVTHFLRTTPLLEHYNFYHNHVLIEKTVTYFLAEVEGTIQLQTSEVEDGSWFSLEAAYESLTFNESKSLLTKVQKLLTREP